MNTTTEAINRLEQARSSTREAAQVIQNLIAEHDYQDVTGLVAQAAESLLTAALELMQSEDEAAIDALENAEDLIDAVYDIIDAEIDED